MSLAPPVSKDGFYYAGDSLYAEASGHNRHRRATLPELHALFHPTSAAAAPKDNTGHWYEAQLRHYGLPPSKNKAVAKTRLLDAVNKGGLAVPVYVQKLETELKKEWTKKEREAKTVLKKAGSTPATKKRKADDGDRGPTGLQSAGAAALLAKKPKSTPKRGGGVFDVNKTDAVTPPVSAARTKNPTMVATRGGHLAGARGGAKAMTQSASQRPKQTARRGGFTPSFVGSKRSIKTENASSTSLEPSGSQWHDSPPQRNYGRLGLLNGLYEIDCSDLREWEQYGDDEFTLILALEGDHLWGAYDFGMFSGVLNLPRPFTASGNGIEFKWRGRENSEGQISHGNNNEGWIKFLGDGKIEGMIPVYGQASFEGIRVSGSETRPERSARSMKAEWENYNEDEYERESRMRWG